MKHFPTLILVLGAAMLFSCNGSKELQESALDKAESAYNNERYAKAQGICDSLVIGKSFSTLDTWDLCRLSLLLMRLAENAGEPETNTAFAARCMRAAVERDSDSTRIYVQAMPTEDQARIMLLTGINEARHDVPVQNDSIFD